MERRTYEAVVLGILVAAAGGAILVRYNASQHRWRPGMVVPLTGSVHRARLDAPRPRLDVNSARVEELDALPYVSLSAAHAIVAHRLERPFTDVAELVAIPGIGARRLEALADYLYCAPVTDAVQRTHEQP